MIELSAKDVGKRFLRRVLFRRVAFSIQGGRSLAITGSNGSGKSTLVRILGGVMRPTKGTITLTVDGAEVPAEDRPFHCGLVAPYLNVYDGFTPRENLRFVTRARRFADAAERIDAVLEQVQLLGRADDFVGTFSSGMKQRMRFAAALVADPEVLLLDEPGSNLDESGLGVVRGIIDGALADGRIVIVATNDPRESGACDEELSVLDFQ